MLFRRYQETLERLKLLYWRVMIPLSIRRAAAVVAVSQFSADEIRLFYPASKDKLFLTEEGVRKSLARQRGDEKPIGINAKEYLLCVATFGRHKNLDSLVRAFAELPGDYGNLSLVFVGAARTPDAMQYRFELERLVESARISTRVMFMDHVSDAQLSALYRGALALVLPSLYEGFGLPIIEAQQLGCPVLCSNVASMPEIAGEAALMFDPRSIDSIRDAIVSLLANPEQAERLRVLGYQNAKRFSWEKAATQLMTAIEFAVGSRSK